MSSSFLDGGGEMGALMRSVDWSRTPLGPTANWPQSLRTTVSTCLNSRFPILIWWGPHLVKIYNDAYRPMLGTKHPAAMGTPGRAVWPEIWQIIGPMLEGVIEQGRATWSEDQYLPLERHGFAEECYFTFSYSPISDESGDVGGIFCAVTETTARVIGERRLTLLQDLSADVTSETTADACRRIADVLARYESDVPFSLIYLPDKGQTSIRLAASSGISSEYAGLLGLQSLAAPGDESWQNALRQTLTTGELQLAESPGLPASRSFVVPLQGPDGKPVGALVAGVSARQPADDRYRGFATLLGRHVSGLIAQTRALESEKRRAEMLTDLDRAKTAFFSNISHEFRTPLTLMLGPTQEALSAPDGSLSGEDLAIVHRNELRLLKLVNTLLDFARIEAGRAQAAFQPTNLAELTVDLASAFRSATSRAGLRFEVDCPPLSRQVAVDREMWERMVLNLVSNALKFTFEGEISVSLEERDDCVQLSVRDTGVGIPESEIPRLFERFHRVHGTRARTHEGSGIGLALVSELVKLHNGTISVESQLGVGTTFTVTLPMLGRDNNVPHESGAGARASIAVASWVDEALQWLPPERPDTAATRASDNVPVAKSTSTILVADDNADMRAYIQRLLVDRWNVETAGDGMEALNAIATRRPALIITDVMMPRLDGYELLARLRSESETSDIPVIMLSARAGEEARIDGLEAGADDYVVKPFAARELLARVEAQLLKAQIRSMEKAHDRRLADVFRYAPVAIAVLKGPEHVYEFANEPFLQMIGRRNIEGKRLRDVHPDLEGQGIHELLQGVYSSGEPFVADALPVTFAREGEEPSQRFFKFVYQPMPDRAGSIEGIAVVAVEVTELAIARREADLANRAKDEFIAMLGHELRNPLAPILTALQLMRLRSVDAFERERTIIERQVTRLIALVDDLLDVSRVTQGKVQLNMVPLELADVVAHAIEQVSPLLEQREHRIEVQIPRSGLRVEGDADRLGQVASNLLTNAAKYTEPGGHIRVVGSRDGETVVLAVSDNGIGIEAAMLPRVFEMFTQDRQSLDRSRGGLGLGLAIVRNLVELHGGTASATSQGSGQGATFTVRLPLAQVDAANVVSGEERMIPYATRGRRILVVDDNEDAAHTLAESLGALGHQVLVALDGPAALASAPGFRPGIALLDIGLPVMDGYELAQRLKEEPRLSSLCLIAVSGYGQERDRTAARDAGFTALIVKPVDLPRLAALIERIASPGLSEAALTGSGTP
ncbi:MAG: ATP-binding protein [Gemmatimonadota bacterium]